MFGKLWDTIKNQSNLLEQAYSEAINMLVTDWSMYELVLRAIKEPIDENIANRVRSVDKDVNSEQREIRKKVYEHLSISGSEGLLTGLILINIVIDLERIGDYTKNIGELVEMIPGKLDFASFENIFSEVDSATRSIFEFTKKALEERDTISARQAIAKYETVSIKCDGTIRNLLQLNQKTDNEQYIQRNMFGLILLMRYMKRTAAHLKNIATTIVNPFHKIGYRA